MKKFLLAAAFVATTALPSRVRIMEAVAGDGQTDFIFVKMTYSSASSPRPHRKGRGKEPCVSRIALTPMK